MTVWRTAETNYSKIGVGAPAPAGSCLFVGASVYPGAHSRFCMAAYGVCVTFDKPSVYASCPTRTEKLKEQT